MKAGSACKRCKRDRKSCTLGLGSAKGAKVMKEVKIKKEPGVDEEVFGDMMVGVKQTSAVKVDKQGPKQKAKKCQASSSASIISIDNLHATSLSIPSMPSSLVVSSEDLVMDFINSSPSDNNADPVSQIFAVLDGILANIKGVVTGVKFFEEGNKGS